MHRFQERSDELEHLDTGQYTSEEYEGCLLELKRVNRWLGDVSALRHSLIPEIVRAEIREFLLLDVGAGSGELLRVVADWARKEKRQVRLTGLELNARSAQAILLESQDYDVISSVRGDARNLPFADNEFDYVVSSLLLHHFQDAIAVTVLREMSRVASRGVFVIDLHRHPLAYYAYTTLGNLFFQNRLIREDGALSILRSFKPNDLRILAEAADWENITVQRKFPFRLVLSGRAKG